MYIDGWFVLPGVVGSLVSWGFLGGFVLGGGGVLVLTWWRRRA